LSIDQYIDANRERFIEELFSLVRIPGLSSTGEHLEECAEHLAGLMRAVGIETSVRPTSTFPVVTGKLGDDPDKPTILLYGHYDVQPADPFELWESPPFEPEIRDGMIYARGSADNKGYLLCHLKAIETYTHEKGDLPVNLKFVFEGCEENNSRGLDEFLAENRDEFQADYVIFADGPRHESGRPWICMGLKGMAYLELKLRTISKDAHSANAAVLPSAAWEMVQLLSKLVDDQGNVLVPGFYDDVLTSNELERKMG